MRDRPLVVATASNLVVAALAMAWAYTSYRNNLLNVGGGVGNVDLWYQLGGIVSSAYLAAWILALALVLLVGLAARASNIKLVALLLLTVALGPCLLFGVSWLLHLGFPASPP